MPSRLLASCLPNWTDSSHPYTSESAPRTPGPGAVREEFGRTDGEVRVTQASRDRGVDAIAFDPDPIRGGKFVIQAKRYNAVVPVSAVRDLYGTMIGEGAVKGILVTTSHFGRDSREFAKDRPIALVDGENLVFLFQKHGRDVHIALLPKGDTRRGL